MSRFVHIEEKQFPLTKKFLPLLSRISFEKHVSIEDCVQEAYISEWKVGLLYPDDYEHRKRVFRVKIRQRINRLAIARSIDKGMLVHESDLDKKEEGGNDLFLSLIKVRAFDELFFEHLVTHVCEMLKEANDSVAAEMFWHRVRDNMTWKRIKESYFPGVPHNTYYGKVNRIKQFVVQEISN